MSLFYNSSKTKDGLHLWCKECNKVRLRAYYIANKERITAQSRARHAKNKISIKKQRDKFYKENSVELIRRAANHRINFPKKVCARRKIQYALTKGLVTRPSFCELCKKTAKVDAHHDDYNKPLEVRFLCRSCHFQWHAKNGPGLNGS